MPTYVAFDTQTGKIVHTHFVPEGFDTSKEDILSDVSRNHDHGALDVAMVQDMTEPRAYRIDPQTRQLIALDESGSRNTGGATAMGSQPAFLHRPVQVVYEGQQESDKSTKS